MSFLDVDRKMILSKFPKRKSVIVSLSAFSGENAANARQRALRVDMAVSECDRATVTAGLKAGKEYV